MNYENITLYLGKYFIIIKLIFSCFFIISHMGNIQFGLIFSIRFIQIRYRDTEYKPLVGLIPGPYFLTTLASACIITQISQVSILKSCPLPVPFL